MFTSCISSKWPYEIGLVNTTPVDWCLTIIIATLISCLGFTLVSFPATVGCAYRISPTAQVSSPTAMELATLPLVSKFRTYPKWVTNPFTPFDISSVANPKYLTSLTLPSATNGAAVILLLPAVTPFA